MPCWTRRTRRGRWWRTRSWTRCSWRGRSGPLSLRLETAQLRVLPLAQNAEGVSPRVRDYADALCDLAPRAPGHESEQASALTGHDGGAGRHRLVAVFASSPYTGYSPLRTRPRRRYPFCSRYAAGERARALRERPFAFQRYVATVSPQVLTPLPHRTSMWTRTPSQRCGRVARASGGGVPPRVAGPAGGTGQPGELARAAAGAGAAAGGTHAFAGVALYTAAPESIPSRWALARPGPWPRRRWCWFPVTLTACTATAFRRWTSRRPGNHGPRGAPRQRPAPRLGPPGARLAGRRAGDPEPSAGPAERIRTRQLPARWLHHRRPVRAASDRPAAQGRVLSLVHAPGRGAHALGGSAAPRRRADHPRHPHRHGAASGRDAGATPVYGRAGPSRPRGAGVGCVALLCGGDRLDAVRRLPAGPRLGRCAPGGCPAGRSVRGRAPPEARRP